MATSFETQMRVGRELEGRMSGIGSGDGMFTFFDLSCRSSQEDVVLINRDISGQADSSTLFGGF